VVALWWLTRPRMGVFGGGWTWPVPDIEDGDPAIVSSGWVAGKHPALDIMYQNPQEGFYALEGTPIRAARGGTVRSVQLTRRGWSVIVDHGKPWSTWYQHLAGVSVREGQVVEAGEQLGTMGIDPMDPQQVRHLHFAIWAGGYGDTHSVDPTAGMATWKRTQWSP
jgi:murein DD-endopeptidase MepM/ murein hydrolase activator NlpD